MSAGDGTSSRADGSERIGDAPGKHPMRAALIAAGIIVPRGDAPRDVDARGAKVLRLDDEARRKAGARVATPAVVQ